MVDKKLVAIIFVTLLFGIIYRLILTSGGNFIFHMDSARDFIDVREMVVLKKLRLIGPTSAIDGFYTGPAWYYILAIPFFLSGGNPYSAIILEIILWAVGGFFLLKLASRWGLLATGIVGISWVASNFVVLATSYSFHPNLIIFLTPTFIYLLEKYLKTGKLILSLAVWFLAGLFFHLEMNYGIFMPAIILSVVLLSQKTFLKTKNFWLGMLVFTLFLLPQAAFDIKHQFVMTKSVLRYLNSTSDLGQITAPKDRLPMIARTFYSVTLPTFMNFKIFTEVLITIFAFIAIRQIRTGKFKEDKAVLSACAIIFLPFLSYVFLPVTVNRWHLGGVMAAVVFLSGFVFHKVSQQPKVGQILAVGAFTVFAAFAAFNMKNYLATAAQASPDQSVYSNEIAAIDYVYQQTNGANFKVYSYLPSVYDYPYQYLFWWYGQKNYGYLPKDYAYLPDKFEYIKFKEKYRNNINPQDSGLIFLIKEPDDRQRRELWENSFKHLQLIKAERIGPLEIEIRKEPS